MSPGSDCCSRALGGRGLPWEGLESAQVGRQCRAQPGFVPDLGAVSVPLFLICQMGMVTALYPG